MKNCSKHFFNIISVCGWYTSTNALPFAYVIASYGGSRHSDASRDHVAPQSYLRVHLAYLAQVPQDPITVLIVRPPLDPNHIPLEGFYDVDDEILSLNEKGIAVEWVYPSRNEGSYSQLFSAFEMTRGRFERYFWTEDDYTAIAPYYHNLLEELFIRSFYNEQKSQILKLGVVMGIPQGYPHETASTLPEHAQTGLYTSSQVLEALYHMKKNTSQQMNSVGDDHGQEIELFEPPRIALRNLVNEVLQRHPSVLNKWNALQVAIGVFFNERSVTMASWNSDYRVPYCPLSVDEYPRDSSGSLCPHVSAPFAKGSRGGCLLDYSGGYTKDPLPMKQVLVAPLQYLQAKHVAVCCDATYGYFGCPLETSCVVDYATMNSTCCLPMFESAKKYYHSNRNDEAKELKLNRYGELETHQWVMKRIASNVEAFLLRKLFLLFRFHSSPFLLSSSLPSSSASPLISDVPSYEFQQRYRVLFSSMDIFCADRSLSELNLRLEYESVMWRNALSPNTILKVPFLTQLTSSFAFTVIHDLEKDILQPLSLQFHELCISQSDQFLAGWTVPLCLKDLLSQVQQAVFMKCKPNKQSPETFIQLA